MSLSLYVRVLTKQAPQMAEAEQASEGVEAAATVSFLHGAVRSAAERAEISDCAIPSRRQVSELC